jgi:5-formyltetrahydrofolate cyclo-ligase
VTSPTDPKAELRRALRRTRPDVDYQSAQSAQIHSHLRGWLAGQPARTIAAFAALPGEPMLLDLLTDFPDRRWVLPRVDSDTMRFHLADAATLSPGSFGIQEPPQDSPVCPTGEIDLFLCPGMAFSIQGARLGRGKGYYDRALAGASPEATKVGVCFSEQFMAELPSEPHDLPMDFLATPIGISSCR